jgi:hypothetical protein
LPPVDGILKHAGTLSLKGIQHRFAIHMESLADIGQGQEGTAIDARLTVDVHNVGLGITQKRQQGPLKDGSPV